MKTIGWIAALIGGFFVLSSFKKETTASLTPQGDQTFSPPKEGVLNKDVEITIIHTPPTGGLALPLPPETRKTKAGTKVSISAFTQATGLYTATYPNYGYSRIKKEDVSFITSFNPVDLINDTINDTKPPAAGTGNQDNKTELPADEYTPYSPVKTGKAKWDIPGLNNFPYTNAGTTVTVTGYQKHYAFNDKYGIVFTDNYEIERNGLRRMVQIAAIQLTTFIPNTINVEGYTSLQKFAPARTGTVNKQATVYTPSGTAIPATQGSPIAVNGSGVLRTNRFGAWENIPVYDATYSGTRVVARVADVMFT